MAFPIQTSATQATCLHGAKATFIATSAKVTISGSPAMLEGDMASIVGCPFMVAPTKPQPCVKVKLEVKAAKVKIENKCVLLKSPADPCESAEGAIQGTASYSSVQSKVTAT